MWFVLIYIYIYIYVYIHIYIKACFETERGEVLGLRPRLSRKCSSYSEYELNFRFDIDSTNVKKAIISSEWCPNASTIPVVIILPARARGRPAGEFCDFNNFQQAY